MKRQAKQFAFMLAGVILGAAVLFVVGMEVGRRADGAFLDDLSPKDDAARGSVGAAAAAATEYSFFQQLDSPVEPRKLRKLKRTFANANNSPEVEAKLKERRARVAKFKARKLARRRATGYADVDRDHAARKIKRLTRNPEMASTAGEAPGSDPKPARDLLANPAESVRTLARTVAPAAAQTTDTSYTLQLGVYRSEREAAKLVSKLRAQGHAPRLTHSSVPGKGEIFRVRMGRYQSIAAADQGRSKVALGGHRAMVTPL